MELGMECPNFNLTSVEGKSIQLNDFQNKEVLLVMFICNHCPYVKAIEDRLIKLGLDYSEKSVQLIAICSNDPSEYPEDSPENLLKRSREKNYPFPYLLDETQQVAQQFGAVCTPDFFMFNGSRKLVYRGRLDDSWKDPSLVQKQELRDAIETTLEGKTPPIEQKPSMGCSIKWK